MNRQPFLSRQEMLDYASRYVPGEEAIDFAHDNDLFCMLARSIEPDKVVADSEGWEFRGYGLCVGYTVDEEEIPLGKWLRMRFISLSTFPPSLQTLKLQPPHAVKGAYQNPQRTEEYRIVKINLNDSSAQRIVDSPGPQASDSPPTSSQPDGKVLAFRKKSSHKRGHRSVRPLPPHE